MKAKGVTGKGNPYLKAALGQMATVAAKSDTFLGERYRRLAKRMPKAKALVAIERSILVVIFHLLADPAATFEELGPDYYDNASQSPPHPQPGPPARSPRPPSQPHRGRLSTPAHTGPAPYPTQFGAGAPSGAPPRTPPGGLNRRAYFTVVHFPVSHRGPAGPSPRGENGVGLPADAVVSLALEAAV